MHSYADGLDSKQWYCKQCKQRKSIHHSLFLDRYHLTLQQISLLVWCTAGHAQNVPQKAVNINMKFKFAMMLQLLTGLTSYEMCVRKTWYVIHKNEIGRIHDSGDPIIVEKDESKFSIVNITVESVYMEAWELGIWWNWVTFRPEMF